MQHFVDRAQERKQLTSSYESETAEFIVLYGRRQLGKSELVRQTIRDRDDAVYYQAIESTAENQLDNFAETVTAAFPDMQNVRRDWEVLLKELGTREAIVMVDANRTRSRGWLASIQDH